MLEHSLSLFILFPSDLSLIPTDCGLYIHWVSLKKIALTRQYIPTFSLTSTSQLEYLQLQLELVVSLSTY